MNLLAKTWAITIIVIIAAIRNILNLLVFLLIIDQIILSNLLLYSK